MTALENHVAAALAALDDRTAWRAFLDHTEETENLTHAEALRKVARLRFNARRVKELCEASYHVSVKGPFAQVLSRVIRAHVTDSGAWHATIFLLPGRKRPFSHHAAHKGSRRQMPVPCISVGARYVLLLVKALRLMDDLPREAMGALAAEFLSM